jgi:hypothetical protein
MQKLFQKRLAKKGTGNKTRLGKVARQKEIAHAVINL